MSEKHCLKCGHTNYQALGLESDSCPSCGAIYARVAAAMAAGKLRPLAKQVDTQPAALSAQAPPPIFTNSIAPPQVAMVEQNSPAFIDTLRQSSLYPTLREVIKILTFVSYLIWSLAGLVAGLLYASQGKLGIGLSAFLLGMFMLVMTKIFKEASLMFMDLADAAVVTAQKLSGR